MDTTPTTSTIGAVADLGTILSIWAHPDDETYLAGGIMACARDLGQRVVCVSATAGERGTADAETWPPLRLGRTRSWEASAAMAVLGVTEHRFLGLPDGALARHDREGRALIGELIDEVAPDTILTFGADGVTFHPDHIAVHRWTTAAWRAGGARARLLRATPTVEHLDRFGDRYESWGMYLAEGRPAGVRQADLDLYARLEGAALDRKLSALRAMATQTDAIVAALGAEEYGAQIAEEAFVAARR